MKVKLLDVKLRIEQLRKAINTYNEEYFNNNESKIEDLIFDQLVLELQELEEQYPEYFDVNSPTQKIGENITNTFEQVKHKNKMESLSKSLTKEQFIEWYWDKIKKGVRSFACSLKIDGTAVSLEYENGILTVAATRGNGIYGDDITATASVISNIPKKLKHINNFTGEIRGEVYLKKSKLDEINKILLSKNKPLLKNPRNAASGILKRKEVSEENKYLSFIAYHTTSGFKEESYDKLMSKLTMLGFEQVHDGHLPNLVINIENEKEDLNSILSFFEHVEKIRDELDCDIDGIVIKVNDMEMQKKLGSKTSVPNWAIAYKFPAQEKITTLKEVVWTMGDKGNITPNARFSETVVLVGASINNSTLHNLNELKMLDIKIGDSIVVSRQGDVIPKVKKVLKELRTGNEKNIEIPSQCPACGAPTKIEGAYLRCSAGKKCSHMKFAKIKNFIKAMEIEEFGEVKIKELVDIGLVNDFADLYDKEIIDFENSLTRVGKRTATKMYNNIQNSKNNDLWMVISGLTIDGVGIQTAKDLANKYKSLESFMKCSVEELITIEGIAETSAEKIVEWCSDKDNINVVNKLIERNIGELKDKIISSNSLEGKVFATSGSLSFSRKELETKIIDNGGQFSSIKKGITHFIAGDCAKQNKIDKAVSFGAKIIDENDFLSMIKG